MRRDRRENERCLRPLRRIAPLLWLRAGARGRRIDTLPEKG